MPKQNNHSDPYILTEPNGDGTSELVAGSFDPFTIVVSQPGVEPAVIDSESVNRFHLVVDTIPSDCSVRVRR